MASYKDYKEIILEKAEVAEIIDFRLKFIEKNATKFIVSDCSEELYYKIANSNPHIKLNLIQSKLEIMPVLAHTDARELEIARQVGNWCVFNSHLVGHAGGPSGAYKVSDNAGGTNILGPDASVVLTQRWNNYIANIPNMPPLQPGEADFPRVAPSFVIELRSDSDSALSMHDKMMNWMVGGVDEAMSIDPFTNIVKVYTMDSATNTINCHEHHNCTRDIQIASQVLPGFALSLYRIF